MSGRGRPQGSFRNQRGFQGVRGNGSSTSPPFKKSRASIRNDTFAGGGSPSTRSATSPSIRTRSLTPVSEKNAVRSSGKYRSSVIGGRLSLGRVGKSESKSSSSSIVPPYNKQNSAHSSSSRSSSPESRKRKFEMSLTNVKKARGTSEKRLTGIPKFQDNPSAPEIVDCNQSNKEQFEAEFNSGCEGTNDSFVASNIVAAGCSDDDSDTDNESNATEPTVDHIQYEMTPLEEIDIATNSNIDEDSLAETDRGSTTQIEPEYGGEEESISSVSDIMSDAVCAFFKESSLNRDSNEENDINPANESSSKPISNDKTSSGLKSPRNLSNVEFRNEETTDELSKYINGKLNNSSSIVLKSKMEVKNRDKLKSQVASHIYDIISVSKSFNGKLLLDSFHSLEFVENMVNKFFREHSSTFISNEDMSSNGNCEEDLPIEVQNGHTIENEKDFKIEASTDFLRMLSKFSSIEIKKAFIVKEARLGRERKIAQLLENKQGATTNLSDCHDTIIEDDGDSLSGKQSNDELTKVKEFSHSHTSDDNDCLILQEIDAANAVSAVAGFDTIHSNDSILEEEANAATLDKNKLITEMEDKFARDTNSALKKRPVYKKHGISDLNTFSGKKIDVTNDQEKTKLSSSSTLAPDSMILRMKEPGEVEISGNKKKLNDLVNSEVPNHKSFVSALSPQNITNGSQGDFSEETTERSNQLESHSLELSDSLSHNTGDLVKSLRKVRVKRGKEKVEEDENSDVSNDVFIISENLENSNSSTSDMAAKTLSYASSRESNQTLQHVRKSPLSPAVNCQISPEKGNQGPRRYYEKKIENNFILSPTILSKADAVQSTVALFKMPSTLTFNSQLNLDGPEESVEEETEKSIENIHVEPTQVSSAPLKTVIRLPKIGLKKKGKRRFAEGEIDSPEDPSSLQEKIAKYEKALQEKKKKYKNMYAEDEEPNISDNANSLAVEEQEYTHESPSPEPQKFNREEESSQLPDSRNPVYDTNKNNNDDKLQGMMVVPEKASSFDIHPQRCCYDVCQYCGLKFGMLDTPMHVSQLKTVEIQKLAVDFTKFKADACLCDKCYRYIDRKARNAETNIRNRMEEVEQEESGEQAETTIFGTPFHKTCFIRNCNKEVTTTIGKKWLLRLKKKLIKRGMHYNLDWERVNKSSLKTNFPLCNKHNAVIEHYVHCGLCKRKLTIGGMCSLGMTKTEVQGLNELLQKDGIPAALVENQFVCKLCTTFCGIGQKSTEPNYFKKHKAHKSFYKDYKKRLHNFLGVEHHSKSEESNIERGGGTKKIHQVSSERNNPIKITIKTLGLPTTTLGPSYNQENNSTKSVRKRRIKENGMKGEATKSHRGSSSEIANTNSNGRKGDNTKSDDDIEVSVKEKHSSDKCSISVHFDQHTKKLWQELHHPYGNYSSFFRHLLLLEKYWRNGDLKLSDNANLKSSNYLKSVQNRIDAYELNHKRSEAELSSYTRPNLSVPAPPRLLHTLESTLDVFSGPMQKSPILATTSSSTELGDVVSTSFAPNVTLSPSYTKLPSKTKHSDVCDSSTILKVPKIAVSLSKENQMGSITSLSSNFTPTVDLTISKSPDLQQVSPPSLPTKIRVRTDLMHLGLMEKQKIDPSPNLMAANPEMELLRKGLQGNSNLLVGIQGSSQLKTQNEKGDPLQPSLSIALTSTKTGLPIGVSSGSHNSMDKYRNGQSNLMQMLNDPPLKVIVPPGLKQVEKNKSITSSLSNHGVSGKLPNTTFNRITGLNTSLSTTSSPIGLHEALGHTQSSNKHLFQNCSNSGSSAIPLTFNNSIAEVLAAAKKAKEQSISPNKLSNILKGGNHANPLPKPDVTITAKSINRHPSSKGAEDYLQKQQHANKASNRMNISFQHFLQNPQNAKNLSLSPDLTASSAATLAELQKSAAETANRLYAEAVNNPLLDMNKLLHTQPSAVAPHLVAQNSLSNMQTLGSSGGITIPIIQSSTTVAGNTSVSTITSKQYNLQQQQQQQQQSSQLQQQQQQQQVNKKNINNILDRLSVLKSNPGTSSHSYSGLTSGDSSSLGNLTQQLRTSSSISPKSNDSIRKSVTSDFTSGGVTASPASSLNAQSQAQQKFNSELSLLLGLTGPATSLSQLTFPISTLAGNTSVTASSSSRVTQSTQNQAAAVAAAAQQQNQAQQAAQAALLMAGAGLPGMNQVAAAAAMQELMKISLSQQQLQSGVSSSAGTSLEQQLTSALTQQLEQQQIEANQKQAAQSAAENSKAIQSLRLRAPPPLTHMGKGGGTNSNTTKPT